MVTFADALQPHRHLQKKEHDETHTLIWMITKGPKGDTFDWDHS